MLEVDELVDVVSGCVAVGVLFGLVLEDAFLKGCGAADIKLLEAVREDIDVSVFVHFFLLGGLVKQATAKANTGVLRYAQDDESKGDASTVKNRQQRMRS